MSEALAKIPTSASAPVGDDTATLVRIVRVFNSEFTELNTTLCPGAAEPLYLPADDLQGARIFSREDFPASALHEVAHWCIAGKARRQQVDFGYWYAQDGRNAEQQRAFQRVEVKPQAIEWALSRAVGLNFRVSIDNLNGETIDPFGFELAVWQQARYYHRVGLPKRAERFYRALRKEFDAPVPPVSLAVLRGQGL
ncbi:hypothetical protein FHR99_000382 [Litorivivens lipolytica]|uniref:Elongation factor P hydroxylase n=1 Tax=Litorivivens lipolytica TaxID=1524264 RepID=A0A7W4W2E2_9GAMM|nr:elongation factor P hydroxylase [Litorivivens lipolytica]MBB3046146.1 hypothetical protein [Litorivivens lipolytica]